LISFIGDVILFHPNPDVIIGVGAEGGAGGGVAEGFGMLVRVEGGRGGEGGGRLRTKGGRIQAFPCDP